MMYSYAISTDSGCDLDISTCSERGIVPFKMIYTMDGVPCTDEMTVESIKDFYDRYRAGGSPKTSQISPSEFIDFFKGFAKEGMPLLHVSLAGAISGSCDNASIAAATVREEYPDWKYRIVDSTQASTGEGLVALTAAELRNKGCTIDECADSLEKLRPSVNALYTTNDLTYLCRGGRVSKVGAIVGTALSIRPILDLDRAGHLKVNEKVRGDKALKRRFVEMVEELVEMPEGQTLYVSHADAPERAKEYAAAILEKCPFKDVFYTYIGSTIGTHTGSGLVAVFFVGKERP